MQTLFRAQLTRRWKIEVSLPNWSVLECFMQIGIGVEIPVFKVLFLDILYAMSWSIWCLVAVVDAVLYLNRGAEQSQNNNRIQYIIIINMSKDSCIVSCIVYSLLGPEGLLMARWMLEPWVAFPPEERALRRHVTADLSSKKLKWQHSHFVTLLYGWSLLVASGAASLL